MGVRKRHSCRQISLFLSVFGLDGEEKTGEEGEENDEKGEEKVREKIKQRVRK